MAALDLDPTARVVILTGAGISVESGLPSFRGADGLWEGHRLEDVATPEAFARDPETVQRFYNERRRALLGANVRPNPAHAALARLEREWPGEVTVVTQNIDDLHERAGSAAVIHMHGELRRARCAACETVHAWDADVTTATPCPACAAPRLRPHVVWFGEVPLALERVFGLVAGCDLFAAIGTSGVVYPAAGLVEIAREHAGARTVEINLEPSSINPHFTERIVGPASVAVPGFVERLLASAA